MRTLLLLGLLAFAAAECSGDGCEKKKCPYHNGMELKEQRAQNPYAMHAFGEHEPEFEAATGMMMISVEWNSTCPEEEVASTAFEAAALLGGPMNAIMPLRMADHCANDTRIEPVLRSDRVLVAVPPEALEDERPLVVVFPPGGDFDVFELRGPLSESPFGHYDSWSSPAPREHFDVDDEDIPRSDVADYADSQDAPDTDGVDAAYDYEMATGLKKGVVIDGDGRVHADGAPTADAGTTSHGATGSVNIRAGTAESGAGGSVRVVLDEANAADVGGSTNMGGSTTGSSTNDVTSTH